VKLGTNMEKEKKIVKERMTVKIKKVKGNKEIKPKK
jgi:hypothetical protein